MIYDCIDRTTFQSAQAPRLLTRTYRSSRPVVSGSGAFDQFWRQRMSLNQGLAATEAADVLRRLFWWSDGSFEEVHVLNFERLCLPI